MSQTTPPGAKGRLIAPRTRPRKTRKEREQSKNKNAEVRAKLKLSEDKWKALRKQ